MKGRGAGLWVVEADGIFRRVSQPNRRYNSGRGQSQIELIHDRDGNACFAARRITYFLGMCVNIHRKRQSGKKRIHFGSSNFLFKCAYCFVDSTPINTAHTAKCSLFTSAERIARA